MPPEDLPTSIHTPDEHLEREAMGRGEAMAHLVGMIETLRARNLALLQELARVTVPYDRSCATVLRFGEGKGEMAVLAWYDADYHLRLVAL